MAELIIRSGKHDGKKLRLPERETLAGRGEECPLRLTSADVSKEHCLLRVTPEGIHVRDLGSRNGTWVNDERITAEVLLRPGDQLRIGPMTFQVPVSKPDAQQFARPPRKPAGPSDPPLSDDDIAAWLNDGAGHVSSSGDTTVIHTGPDADDDESPHAPAAPELPQPLVEAPVFRGGRALAAEAAEVIRRWQNRQSARQSES